MTTITAEIPIHLVEDCQLLTVDIAAPFLRRCFTNTYTVHYCNYSAETVEDGRIEIQLDELLEVETSELTFSNPSADLFIFNLGNIATGTCHSFTFQAKVSCEAEFGQTHCVEAKIFPAEICEPNDPKWTGASISVEGLCDGDSVRFRIKNVGNVDMLKQSGFIVTEDVLMFKRGVFQLDAGASILLSFPANGSTYHLVAEQEDFHPGRNNPTIHVEGCGGLNTPGLATAIALNDGELFVSKDCQENVGAFDPNDKSAVPTGIGSANYIPKNTDLTYKIRFQNTGTDTAFNIVILDMLSNELDPGFIETGAASHDYQFQLLTDSVTNLSVLKFSFSNIMLPDSNVNEAASHGFVQFKVAQQLELVEETRIKNSAAIFFDFNEAVITNTVFHTIGLPFGRFITSVPKQLLPLRDVVLQPNPFSESTLLIIGGETINRGEIKLFNTLGSLVHQQVIAGNEVPIYRNNLPSGFYMYSIVTDNQLIATGKIQMNQK